MAYPQKLLSEGERVVHDIRPHWRSLVFPIVALLVIVGVTSFLMASIDNSTARWIILGAAVVAAVVFVVRPFLVWLTTEYVFTTRRIITRTGIIARSGRDMPLSKVNDVSFSYTMVERALGCGTLVVESAGEGAGLRIQNVPRVEELQREVARLHEEDDTRRRRGPAPEDTSPTDVQ